MIDRDLFDEAIAKARPEIVLRAQRNRETVLALENGEIVERKESDFGGVSSLVRDGHTLRFVARPGFGKDSIREIINLSNVLSGFARFEGKVPMCSMCGSADNLAGAGRSVGFSDKVDFLRWIDDYLVKHDPALLGRFISLEQYDVERVIATGYGTKHHSLFIRYSFILSLTAENAKGESVSIDALMSGGTGIGTWMADEAALLRKLDAALAAIDRKRHAVSPRGGERTCILGPDPACMLVHEAIGHTCESDLVLGGSIAERYLGQVVASPLVTLGDYAMSIDGAPVPQPIMVDDEGVATKDAVLIDNGVLTGYMHDRDSAAHLGHNPTGNARAFAYSDHPIIRMRNTAIKPGTATLDEMIASVDDGLYLVQAGMGQADTTGEFMIAICEGYEIHNGKLGDAITDTVISGYAFPVMKSVEMVGNTIGWDIGGMCGKGQMMLTAAGSPTLKCTLHVGG